MPQAKNFLAAVLRGKIVARFEKDRINSSGRHEVGKFHDASTFRLRGFQFCLAYDDIFVLFRFVAFQQVGLGNNNVAAWTEDLLFDPAFAGVMKLVEVEAFFRGSGKQRDRHRDSPEAQGAAPHLMRSLLAATECSS